MSEAQIVTLARWYKKNGDPVTEGESICEIETDKATVDLDAPTSGILHQLVEEGSQFRLGFEFVRIDPME
ncbi:MAG TPA: lipoyl domain-containing protein [Tepidisphaeraceae bacterium]|jgi:pyruvate/2-oxoglutarate dehydrogenase complex dihydrolipoamide acyltransferase (E2) component|nr:lipoyl domain-containing protein [Tepidisphaeraceae bacterium]